jgi:hypothetical protein
MVHPELAKLVLELDELREVRNQLRLAPMTELDCGKDQSAGDRERR